MVTAALVSIVALCVLFLLLENLNGKQRSHIIVLLIAIVLWIVILTIILAIIRGLS
jgi:hypothetical protein